MSMNARSHNEPDASRKRKRGEKTGPDRVSRTNRCFFRDVHHLGWTTPSVCGIGRLRLWGATGTALGESKLKSLTSQGK